MTQDTRKAPMIRFYAIAVALSVLLFLSKSTFAQFVPPDLDPGDMYHLVFVTEGKADATVGRSETATLVDYDAFVQGEAVDSPALTGTDQGVTYKAIVSAWDEAFGLEIAARDHAVVTAPVYLLNGGRVADGSDDMWDGNIQRPINVKQDGYFHHAVVWTGTDFTGDTGVCMVEDGVGTAGLPSCVGVRGNPTFGSTLTSDERWVDWGTYLPDDSFSYYALSDPLTVPVPEPTASMLLLMGIVVSTMAIRQRQAARV
jgi:hypothetical protein